uniref:Uncharacterized protein n=1 Tax=Panagrolaimus davidi TaxID=227884 RepID=A0A914P0F4_9BILA
MPRIPAAKKARQESILKNRASYKKPEIPETSDAITDDVPPIPDIPQPSTTRSLTKFKKDELEVPKERAPLSDKKRLIWEGLISQKNKRARQARTDKAKEEQPDGDDPFNSNDDIARVDILEDNVPDVMSFPTFQTNQFIPKSTSSISSFTSSSNSPQDLSKPGL